jgi:hypothetical protein
MVVKIWSMVSRFLTSSEVGSYQRFRGTYWLCLHCMFLQNIGKYLEDYAASHYRRPQSTRMKLSKFICMFQERNQGSSNWTYYCRVNCKPMNNQLFSWPTALTWTPQFVLQRSLHSLANSSCHCPFLAVSKISCSDTAAWTHSRLSPSQYHMEICNRTFSLICLYIFYIKPIYKTV